MLRAERLDIPLIPAGGIFTGSDAAGLPRMRVLPPCRWPRASRSPEECGLPDEGASRTTSRPSEDEIEVNQISPTGYPMRMLKSSPAIGSGIRPNCEAYGYLLDSTGKCAVHRGLQPRGGGASRMRSKVNGDRQDLSVHPHAQLRLLDLRPPTPTA
jgi:hypothetical protein